MRLPINIIRTDGGTLARATIHQPTVLEYAIAMQNGHHFPPIVVFFDNSNYWLVDGFHRFDAARHLNYKDVEVDLKFGDLRQAILYAVGANAAHGLRRTPADKKHVVKLLLEDTEWGKWSDRAIARYTVTSHTFVAKVRSTLTGNVASKRTYTSKHGTQAVMDTSNIGSWQKKNTYGDSIKLNEKLLEKLKSIQHQWKTESLEETLEKLLDSQLRLSLVDSSSLFFETDENNNKRERNLPQSWQRWLGIDPGLGTVRWAILEGDADNTDLPLLLDYGTINTTPKETTSKRLSELEADLKELLREFRPTHLALELPLFGDNMNLTRKINEAIGVIELVCYREFNLVPIHLYPSMWKAHIGYGRADNEEVTDTVSSLFNLRDVGRTRLDALAISYAGFCGVKIEK